MALQTFNLGTFSDRSWSGNIALRSSLLESASSANLSRVQFNSGAVSTLWAAIETSGPELISSWESYPEALTLIDSEGLSVTIGGPNAAGSTRDSSEPYQWFPNRDERGRLISWFDNRAAGNVRLVLRDQPNLLVEVDLPIVIIGAPVQRPARVDSDIDIVGAPVQRPARVDSDIDIVGAPVQRPARVDSLIEITGDFREPPVRVDSRINIRAAPKYTSRVRVDTKITGTLSQPLVDVNVGVDIRGSQPPVLEITTESRRLFSGAPIRLRVNLTNTEYDITSIVWTTTGGTLSNASVLTPTWTPPPRDIREQVITLTLTVTDAFGFVVTDSVTMTVPEITATISAFDSPFLLSPDRREIVLLELTPKYRLTGFTRVDNIWSIPFSEVDRGVFRELLGVVISQESDGTIVDTSLTKRIMKSTLTTTPGWLLQDGRLFVRMNAADDDPDSAIITSARVKFRFATDSVRLAGHYYKPWLVAEFPGSEERDSEQGLFAVKTAESGNIRLLNVDGWWSQTASTESDYIWYRANVQVKVGGSYGQSYGALVLSKAAVTGGFKVIARLRRGEQYGAKFNWSAAPGVGKFDRPEGQETIWRPSRTGMHSIKCTADLRGELIQASILVP